MSLENKIIDYKENKEDIIHWSTLKGIYRYEKMISFMEVNQIELSWKNITNYMRYDKRILYNSFKYIVVLEEFFKSLLAKNTDNKIEDILKLEYSQTIKKLLSLNIVIDYDEIDYELLKKEKGAIVSFRNSVVHNKMLLDGEYRGIEDEKNNVQGKNLKEILEIYKRILPKSYRNGFTSDIYNCSKDLNIDERFRYNSHNIINEKKI